MSYRMSTKIPAPETLSGVPNLSNVSKQLFT